GEVGDPVQAGAGGEHVGAAQGGEGGEPAGGAPADHHAVAVHEALGGEVAGGGQAVLDVDDAPPAVEEAPVGAAVARRAAVVDIDHREAPRGPRLGAQVEHGAGGAGGAAVDHHHQ